MSGLMPGAGFGSRVGTRIFLLFLLAAIIPVTFTAYLTYVQTNRGLQEDAYSNLRTSAKSYGMEFFSRLQSRQRTASAMLEQFDPASWRSDSVQTLLQSEFRAIWRVSDDNSTEQLFGHRSVPIDPGRVDHEQLDDGGAQLMFVQSDLYHHWLMLLAHIDGNGDRFLYVFDLDSASIWSPQASLPYQENYCVFLTSGIAIVCTQDIGTESSLGIMIGTSNAARPIEWTLNGTGMLSASWQLFLRGEFAFEAVNVVTMLPANFARRWVADFRSIFPQAITMVVLLVVLFSFAVIRRSLVPLRKLTEATRSYSDGNLDERVSLNTSDEFQQLGDAFNRMAANLGEQITTLQVLSEIDRQIISGSALEDIATYFLKNIKYFLTCKDGFVVVRDPDSPDWSRVVSQVDGRIQNERIHTGSGAAAMWQFPPAPIYQVTVDDQSIVGAILRDKEFHSALAMPVIVHAQAKGVVVLTEAEVDHLAEQRRRRCLDLVGRLAVGMTSVEREEILYRQAHYDELTGLPNRQLLKDRLNQALSIARRNQSSGALLFLDIDRFKTINDVFGHTVGDKVLMQAAERLVAESRETDTVARLGGDEFVILVSDINPGDSVREIATRILARLSEPFSIADSEHYLGASIGIVKFPNDGDSVETLLKNADAAMYRAKDGGRSRFEYFSEKLDAESRRKILLERDLKAALRDNQLNLHYQPQFVLKSGVLRGAEALLRWNHKDLGRISPDEFIRIAEETELILDIGLWVLDQACLDLRQLMDEGLHPGSISINVSARQLRNASFVNDVVRILQKHNVGANYLELEVTETAVAQNRDTAGDVLRKLRRIGVHVAMDDFGTGYSSLSYLQQLPFDVLKIDQAFVRKIGGEEGADSICRAVITMAHELDKKVIAEGVETADQADFLEVHQCEFVQGYYFSKPLPRLKFFEFIRGQDSHTQRRRSLESR